SHGSAATGGVWRGSGSFSNRRRDSEFFRDFPGDRTKRQKALGSSPLCLPAFHSTDLPRIRRPFASMVFLGQSVLRLTNPARKISSHRDPSPGLQVAPHIVSLLAGFEAV